MEQKVCILVADDDPEIRGMVMIVLEKAGFKALQAENGLAAIQMIQQQPIDLVLMDVMMPVLDGIQSCRRIRQFSDIPIIFLTVQAEEEVLAEAFSAGAHDYIYKPFRPKELVVRIQAVLQRSSYHAVPPSTCMVYLELELDPKTRVVRKAGSPLNVTQMGYHLIEYFMRHMGEVVSKTDLLRDVWDYADTQGGDNMVEAAIKRLRKDLQDDSREPRYIKTIWGMGYRFGEKNSG